jgi:hypothetical protein
LNTSGLPLFERAWQQPPRARRTDPSSSHAAADRAERSGLIRGHAALIVRAVVERPGTAKEVGARVGLTNVQVARRAPELEADGWILREGPGELVMWATEKARGWVGAVR